MDRLRRCLSCRAEKPVTHFASGTWECLDCSSIAPRVIQASSVAPTTVSYLGGSITRTALSPARVSEVVSYLPSQVVAPAPVFVRTESPTFSSWQPTTSYGRRYISAPSGLQLSRASPEPLVAYEEVVTTNGGFRSLEPEVAIYTRPGLVSSIQQSSVSVPVPRHTLSPQVVYEGFRTSHEQNGAAIVTHSTTHAQSASATEAPLKPSYHEDITSCIGNTPMVKLNRVVEGSVAKKVLVKLEMQNPGGSVKDRIAKSMIEEAEKEGIITPGKTTIIEYTSGNTGIGLAMMCAAKGYGCIIVMPQVPAMKERYLTCRKFGAAVHLTAASKGMKGAEEYVLQKLKENPDYWCPRQFSNPANPKAHVEHTGPEIWEQTGGDIDILVAGAGTGGTVSALARYLKTKNPNIHVVLVEPSESRVLVGGSHTPHSILGIGAGFTLPFIEELAPGQEWKEGPRGVIEEFHHCSGPDAIKVADQLAAKEGLLVGPSAGAAVKVALDVARRPESAGKTIVVICASSGIRYVTHPMWAQIRAEGDEAMPAPPNQDPEPLLKWTSP